MFFLCHIYSLKIWFVVSFVDKELPFESSDDESEATEYFKKSERDYLGADENGQGAILLSTFFENYLTHNVAIIQLQQLRLTAIREGRIPHDPGDLDRQQLIKCHAEKKVPFPAKPAVNQPQASGSSVPVEDTPRPSGPPYPRIQLPDTLVPWKPRALDTNITVKASEVSAKLKAPQTQTRRRATTVSTATHDNIYRFRAELFPKPQAYVSTARNAPGSSTRDLDHPPIATINDTEMAAAPPPRSKLNRLYTHGCHSLFLQRGLEADPEFYLGLKETRLNRVFLVL